MGQEVVRWDVSTGQHQFLTLAIHQRHRRTDVLARSRSLRGIHDRNTGQTCELIGLALDGHTFVHTAELHRTRHLSDDRVRVGIPGSDDVAGSDGSFILNADSRTIRHLVALTLAADAIKQRQFT